MYDDWQKQVQQRKEPKNNEAERKKQVQEHIANMDRQQLPSGLENDPFAQAFCKADNQNG